MSTVPGTPLPMGPAVEAERPVAIGPAMPAPTLESKIQADINKFNAGLKKFFTSPVVGQVAQSGISILELIYPGLTLLLTGIGKSIAVAQNLAAQANPTGDNTAQITALTIGDAQQVFQTYQDSTGTVVETAAQKAIVADFVALLQKISASSVPAGTASTVS